tara:strand:+ start:133 stop:306 length:174 start_codon:yes stop_codon:yes gene_type:complete
VSLALKILKITNTDIKNDDFELKGNPETYPKPLTGKIKIIINENLQIRFIFLLIKLI